MTTEREELTMNYCMDAENGEPHGGHAFTKPTGLGEQTILWCEGTAA